MRKIAFVNRKGGVGKTTLSLLVAACLDEAGQDVGILDTDPQQGALQFGKQFGLRVVGVPNGIRDVDPNMFGLAVIDTAPSLTHKATLEAWEDADLCVLVTSPSPDDFVSTAETLGKLRELRGSTDGVRLLLNSVHQGTKLSEAAGESVAALEVEALTASLTRRQGYQWAKLKGMTALKKPEQMEVMKVAMGILTVLAGIQRKSAEVSK